MNLKSLKSLVRFFESRTRRQPFRRGRSLLAELLEDRTMPATVFLSGPESLAHPVVPVALQQAATGSVSIHYAVAGGTAVSGKDYVLPAGTLTFHSGDTVKDIPLTILNDGLPESNETIVINLSAAKGAALGPNTQIVYTILKDEPLPSLTFASTTGSGPEAKAASFQVSLSAKSTVPVTVQYAVTGGTATAGVDYTLKPGKVTFKPGQTLQTVAVPIGNDKLSEPNETFQVSLSSPINATLGGNTTFTYTIIEDDPLPSVAFTSAAAAGLENQPSPVIPVSLSAVSGQPVVVQYSVTGGSAKSGVNFVLANGMLTFPAGAKTENLPLAVLDDGVVDGSTTVQITLSSPGNATLGTKQVFTYTISNVDPLPSVAFVTTTGSGPESSAASLQVSLSAASTKTVTVHYAVTGGTATGNGVDYTLKPGTLTFKPGKTTATLTIPIANDKLNEPNETIQVALASPANAKLGANSVFTYTITDNDPAPSVGFVSAAGSGLETVANPSVPVSLSAVSGQPITVSYTVTGGTGASGINYALAAGTLTFNPGDKTKSIPLTIIDDGLLASSKTVQITLSSPGNATLGTSSVFTYTIQPAPSQVGLDITPPVVFSSATYSATTGDLTVTGQVGDNFSGVASLTAHLDGNPAVPVSLGASNLFTIDLPLGQVNNGGHTLYFTATDHAGNTDNAAVPLPIFDLSPGSQTGVPGSHTTTDGTVTLQGTAPANVTITLVGTSQQTLSSSSGVFQIPNISLAVGANPFTLQATDASGNIGTFTLTITRTQATNAPPNAVIVWNQATLNAIETDGTDPLMASRALAMVQSAVYDAVNNIDGAPVYYVKVPTPADASIGAAVDAAAHGVLVSLYPAQQATFDSLLTAQLALLPSGQGTTDGATVGQAVGNAIIAMRADDGSKTFVDFEPGSAPGQWQPTAPMYAPALDPQGGSITPFALTSDSQFDPAGPPAITSQQWAAAVNQVESLGAINSTARTSAQTTLAQFWNDGVGTYTPSGHWNQIAQTVAQRQGDSLADDARLFAELDVSMADAGFATWNTKYLYDTWRPITVIRGGADGVNPAVTANATWTPLLNTPNFPEYTSGHSSFSMAAATVLDSVFGDNVTFTTTEQTTALSMTYNSFQQAATDAGMSRLYGGIHFLFSIQDGWATGQQVANFDLATFNVSHSTRPPKITVNNVLPSGASNQNVTITGQVTDYVSGVASLAVQVDGGAYAPLTFDPATGNFSYTTTFTLGGAADGPHTIAFQAANNAGIMSTAVPFTFALASKAPTVTVTSLTDGGTLPAGATLTGAVTTSGGAAVVALSYAFDGGAGVPLAFGSGGSFSQTLNLSKLAAGTHTLVVTATDAAGNITTQTLHLTLNAAIPLQVSNLTPAAGSSDVSVTFRPVVTFTRPIDTTTISTNNFYALDSSGAMIAASIVPSDDGTSATMFFANPLAGSATYTLVVDGSTIKASDGTLLDAADSGVPGSKLTTTFTTVTQTPVPGTSLVGIVADPGPDGQPGTRDDVRSGPDGTLGTADDTYLFPIAGATVYIIGEQSSAVISDSTGHFTLSPIPSGDVKLVIDGRTATNDPSGVFYPEMVFDLDIQPGVANTVMGTMGTLQEQNAQGTALGAYLPRIQSDILKPAGGNTPTTITLNPDAATSTLTSDQASEYSITVAPNSLIGMDGQKMSSGMVGFSTVAPSLIRDMLPQGVMQLATTLTIQAPGVATFSTPLQITFANVYGAAPGSTLDVYSFNHTTGMLEITGTATVSADGLTVTTNPDSGVTHPGWFGVTPPGDCGGDGGPPPQPTQTAPTQLDPTVTPLVIGMNGTFPTQTFTESEQPPNPPPPPPPGCPPQQQPNTPYLQVDINVDGPLSVFMKQTGSEPLETTSFNVYYGSPQTLSASALSYDDMFKTFGIFGGGLASINSNYLFGSKITITKIYHHADGSSDGTKQDFYLYRVIDDTDGSPEDGMISFEKTLDDGKIERDKPLTLDASAQSMPTVGYTGSKDFGVMGGGSSYTLTFTPKSQGDQIDNLTITSANGKVVPNPIKLEGNGIPQEHLFFDTTSLANTLAAIYNGTDPNATAAEIAKLKSLVTPANRAMATPADFSAIATSVSAKAAAFYNSVNEGITTTNSATAPDTIDVVYTSIMNAGGLLFGDSGPSTPGAGLPPSAGGVDNIADIGKALTKRSMLNQESQNYVLAQALNEKTLNAPYNGRVEVYVNSILAKISTKDQLINFLAKDAGHEPGHTFGLTHTGTASGGTFTTISTGGFLGIGATNGITDLMASGATPAALNGTSAFQPGLTLEALKMGLGLNWTQDDAQTAYTYYTKSNALQRITGAPAPDQELDPADPSNVDGENDPPFGTGPLLDLLTTQTGQPISSNFDFGNVAIDPSGVAPATTSFTLVNEGSVSITLNSVALTSGSAFFSVSGVTPGTVIAPGNNMQFQVSFDPAAVGSASANLAITSNDPNSPLNIVLTGFGQSAAPAAQLSIVNNNLSGVEIGQSVSSSHVATITNNGTQPLLISSVQVEAGGSSFALTGLPADLASNPISLAFGQSITFGVQYTASTLGLERAKIDIGTNDPNQPTVSFGVIGTGLASVVYPHWGNDYVAIEFPNLASGSTLRTVSDSSGHFSFFLPADQEYHIAIFDPVTGLIANGYGVTPDSGTGIDLTSSLVFGPSTGAENVYGALPTDIAFAVGTNPNKASTAGDGIDDFTHIVVNHTSALSGKPLATGVVASAPLSGDAQDLTLVGSTTNSANQTAYVATGSYSLAIVDASNPLKPIVLSQLQLGGNSAGVAVDPLLQIAAVASGSVLNLVDVSNSAQPKLLQSVKIEADSVKVLDGIAYVAGGSQITAVDMKSGNILDQESLSGGNIDDMSIAGGSLYVVAHSGIEPHTVYKILLNGSSLDAPVYSVVVNGHPTFGRLRIFAGQGYVYVGAADNNDSQQIPGVEVIQDTGTALTLVGPSTGITAFDAAVDSSGLAVYCGGLQFSNQVGLLDLSDPTKTGTVVTTFNTAGTANTVVIAEGYAFIADGSGGLAVVNFLPFDTKGIAPKVSISLPASSIVGTSGTIDQVLEGSQLSIRATATDDVQVRNVQLLVNGQVVENAVSYPFDLSLLLPTVAQQGSTPITLQVQATDTGGNVGVSNVITIQVVKDTTAPVLVSANVPEGAHESQHFNTAVFGFSKPLDPATVTAGTFSLTGPSGTVTPVSITLLQHNKSVEIVYPTLATGSYQLVIDAAHVTDKFGNAMGSSPFTRDFTIQQYSAVWINAAGGDWSDATNWQGGVLPKAGDDVLIDVAGGATITFSQGTAQVHSLLATNPFTISGGQLIVTTTLEADGGMQLADGTLSGAELLSSGTLTASGGTLDGVKIDNALTVPQGDSLTVTNGLTLAANLIVEGDNGSFFYPDLLFQGTQTLAGTGKLIIGTKAAAAISLDANADGSPAILTIASGVTVQGRGAIAAPSDASLHLPTIVNEGNIAVTTANQTLSIAANLSNPGTIQVGDKDTLILGGIQTLADLQNISVTGSGRVIIEAINGLAGAAISNSGNTLMLDSLPNWLQFGAGGGINGGAVNAAAPFTLPSTWDLTLNGVTNKASLTIGAGATLRFQGIGLQQGSIALAAGTLDLGGDFHLADLGSYTRTGGTVNLTGILENAGQTFTLDNTTGSWNLAGGTILGGTIATSGSAQLTVSGAIPAPFLSATGTLDGVILQANLTVGQGASLFVLDNLTLDATLTVEGSSGGNDINIDGTQTISGTGEILLGTRAPATLIVGEDSKGKPGVLTLGSGVTIAGQGSIEGSLFQQASSTGIGGNNGGNSGSNGDLVNQGTIAVTTAGQLLSILTDLHNTAQIQVADKTTLVLGGTLTLADLQGVTVSGSGVVQLTGTLDNTGGTLDLTQLPSYLRLVGARILGGTLTTGNGSYTLAAGADLTLDGVTLQGHVIVPANATVTMAGNWTNAGTLDETGGTLNLDGNFTLAALGTLNRTGGTVNLTGTLDNTGTTLALTAATGSWNLQGGTLKGGTYTATGGAELVFSDSGGTLDGLTANSTLDLRAASGTIVHILDGLTLNNATIFLGDTAGDTDGTLVFDNTGTLGGTGSILFGGSPSNGVDVGDTSTLTIGSGITIHGGAGALGYGYYSSSNGTIINLGTIAADNAVVAGDFAYDQSFSGGFAYSNYGTISASGVTNPAPAYVYQNYREGTSFSYALAGLTPNGSYTVRLHFAESYDYGYTFNVGINNTQVLTAFHIATAAGGVNKAVVEPFNVTADGSGRITIAFAGTGNSYAQVNGIEVLSGTTQVLAIACGLSTNSGITITGSPTFTNEGMLSASNNDSLSISGAWTNAAGATITATNATLNLGDPYSSSNTWSNAGTLTAANSTVNLGGTFTLASVGSLTQTGSTINILGTLDNTGSTLALNAGTGSYHLAGGTIKGGTYSASGGAALVFSASGGTLDGLTASSDLDLSSGPGVYANVTDGLTLNNVIVRLGDISGTNSGYLSFSSNETLGGTGSVLFGASGSNGLNTLSGVTLTIGSGITIHGGSGYLGSNYYYSAGTIVNQGTIAADGAVPAGDFGYDAFFTGGYAYSSSAAIDTSAASNPAPAYVYQSYREGSNFSYNLTGLTPNASYTVRLHFAEYYYDTANNSPFDVTLNGTQVLTDFDIFTAAGGKDKAVVEPFTVVADNNGDIAADFAGSANYDVADLSGIQVLSGSTQVLAVNAGQTPTGITINSQSFTNQHALSASNGETLNVNGAWSNAAGATITAANATLNLGDQSSSSTNAWSNAGTITATNSTVNFGGVFTQTAAGSLSNSGSTINLVGTLDNTGSTLAFTASTGSWHLLGGTVKGGTYSASGGAALLFTTSGGTLDGVTADSDLNLNTDSSPSVTIKDGLTLNNATVYLGNVTGSTYGVLYFDNTETLGGTGTVLFGGSSSNSIDAAYGDTATLTIGSGITIRGGSGDLRDYYTGTIINQGTIQADGSVAGGDFAYDNGYNGGYTTSTSDTIDTSGVTNPAPQYVYQSVRYGQSFSYTLGGLTAGTSYNVRLHFAESYWTSAGQRVFNVSANGTAELTNFDVLATPGAARDRAVIESFTVAADGNGQISLTFSAVTDSAMVSGIEVLSGSTQVLTVNAGDPLSSGITIEPTAFTNQHVLAATNGAVLNIDGAWTNAAGATITATGTTLNLGDQYSYSTNAWSNAGTITATNSTVNLGGVVTTAGLGTFNHTGSTVNITGTLDNTGTTLALDSSTGSWNLLGGTIKGGSYSASGGAALVLTNSGGTLDGLTADSDLNLNNNSSYVHVKDGLTLNNTTIRLGDVVGSVSGYLYFDNDETLGGTGTVLLGRSSSNGLAAAAGGAATLTIGPGITIRGGAGGLNNYYSATIVNQGAIQADGSVGSGDFAYDNGFTGGSTSSTSDVIDTSALSNPAPQYVYQNYRYGQSFSYALGGLTPNTTYTIRLHFDESYWTSAGQRVFDVSANGTAELTNFDVLATPGAAKDKAVIESFMVAADNNGQISLAFTAVTDSAMVSGIEVLSGTTQVLSVSAGLLLYSGITANPDTFTNQGTLLVSNGDSLSVSGLSANVGTAALIGTGSSLTLSGTGYSIDKGLTAAAGETLSLNGAWTNLAGSTISATGATLNLGDQNNYSTNAWTNAGTITATNSTVNLGGAFTPAALGTFNRTGGTVNVVGTLDNTGTTLALTAGTGSWSVAGGTITGGNYSASGGAALVFTNSGGTLDGLTANSDLDLSANSSAYVHIKDGLTLNNATVRLGNASGSTYGYMYFDNDETLGGTGTVLLGFSSSNGFAAAVGGNATLTIGSGITIRGGAGALNNYYTATIVNNGTIQADGSVGSGDFAYDNGFTGGSTYGNSDTIDTSAANAAPAYVYQSYRYGYGAGFSYALSGLTPGNSYTVRLHFAEIYYASAGSNGFDVTLNGTTVLSDFDIFAAAGGKDKAVVEPFTTTADANGVITASFVGVSGAKYGQVNGIEVLSGGTKVLTVNAGLQLNSGITINPTTFTNQGTLLASNGDSLSVTGAWTSAAGSTISATGGTLNLGDQNNYSTNAWTNAGTITATNSTVNLGGAFTLTALGTFNRSGGTVNVVGTLDDTGTGLALSASTGSWTLAGGIINSGTFSASGGAALIFTSSGGTLDGLTANSDLNLNTNPSSYVHIKDGLTLNNTTIRLGDVPGSVSGYLYFDNDETLGGTGTVLLGRSSSNGLTVAVGGAATLTIDSGITIRGGSGGLNNYYSATIINKGTIQADGSVGSGDFAYDNGFTGGSTASTSDTIDTSAANSAPQYVYQTYRYGSNFSYTLSGFTPGDSYNVRLHFAESFWTSAGQRVFNVSANGTAELSNFDVLATPGAAKDKAVVEPFTIAADSNGQITLTFSAVTDNAMVSGIEVLSGSTQILAVSAGLTLYSGITINPDTFTNQGTLLASNGDSLSISNLQPNSGIITADVGGTVNINGDFSQGAGGILNVQVAGTAAGQYGTFAVSGAATLADTLNVLLSNSFDPPTGSTFTIMTYGSESGTFDTINGLSLPNSKTFTPSYNVTEFTLTTS